ncbi:hypothetical protein CAPTEDRAFT_220391 [Capitella teleta]|uniref:RRM domain-containing protein n=1 Tax=Capitella teleta TaxID=283909 RepID=R7UM08_CAPTE|nr:hypothetical protein CAPTEDRAFT_220391 [Capitella teleta]|eukprot:ELU07265.1 hypothetical protein CAPTEDRAFT_220391 [Capitella teleta]
MAQQSSASIAKRRRMRKQKLKLADAPPPKVEKTEKVKKKRVRKHGGNKDEKKYVVFVGKLSPDVTEEDLKLHFRQTRGVQQVRLLTDKDTGESRRCAFIQFTSQETHMLGLRLNASELKGRKISVEFTKPGKKTELRMTKIKEKNEHAKRFRMIPPTKSTDSKENKKIVFNEDSD